jgi:hypothetical protein
LGILKVVFLEGGDAGNTKRPDKGRLIVPKGRNTNSRVCNPRTGGLELCDPCGVECVVDGSRGLSPTAIHVWPLRGLQSKGCVALPLRVIRATPTHFRLQRNTPSSSDFVIHWSQTSRPFFASSSRTSSGV